MIPPGAREIPDPQAEMNRLAAARQPAPAPDPDQALDEIKDRFAGIHCDRHPHLQAAIDRAVDDAYALGTRQAGRPALRPGRG